MFREARLVYDEKNDTPKTLISAAATVSHEVSHQVSCFSWCFLENPYFSGSEI